MAGNVLGPMWKRATSWFDANAQHVTVEFIPDPGGSPVPAYKGYLRIFIAEGFLAKAATWGNKHFPVLHGGAALTYLGKTTPFTRFGQPSGTFTSPGAQLDFLLTPLLPFSGDVVEVAPPYDQTGNTALVGATMMFEILCLIAYRHFGVGSRPAT